MMLLSVERSDPFIVDIGKEQKTTIADALSCGWSVEV